MEVSGQRHATAALYPRGKETWYPLGTGGWGDPRVGVDREVRGKISCIYRGSNRYRPVVQSLARQYTD
jgi:hypothetical protein